jgi:hypothetical protein
MPLEGMRACGMAGCTAQEGVVLVGCVGVCVCGMIGRVHVTTPVVGCVGVGVA